MSFPRTGTLVRENVDGPGTPASAPDLADNRLEVDDMAKRTCSIDGCNGPHAARGWCYRHWQRWKNHGDPLGGRPERPEFCSVDGCDSPHASRGWCAFHYQRWYKFGDPLAGPPRRIIGDDTARFWAKVTKHPDGCWIWTASRNNSGYANIKINGVGVGAHRYSYELHNGPIPEGMDLDHLCRVRHCVNPDHLEPVTRSENVLRAVR